MRRSSAFIPWRLRISGVVRTARSLGSVAVNENQGSAGKPGSAEPTGGVAGRFAITSVAQLGAAAAGGLFALVIGRSFGTSAETDGLFAAYSAYTVMMMIAQSLRLSMVP